MNRDSVLTRLLGTIVFGCVPVLLVLLAILNMLEGAANLTAASDQEAALANLSRRMGLDNVTGRPADLSGMFVEGSSLSVASAAFRQHLADVAARAEANLIETGASSGVADPAAGEGGASSGGAAQPVVLDMTLDTDNGGLASLLRQLESGVPLVEISSLAVRRAVKNGEDEDNPTLRVTMTAKAFWKAPVTP